MTDFSNKKFVSLDLELEGREIIQIGVCIGSQNQSEEEWILKKWFVKPEAKISEFITSLTGITQADVDTQSMDIPTIYYELEKLIVENDCFVNPVTWGGGDSSELLNLFKENNIECKILGRRWIDVKTICVFEAISSNKNVSGGLGSAMGRYKLHFIGKAHRADVDAFNTLRLWFRLLDRQSTFIGVSRILANNINGF